MRVEELRNYGQPQTVFDTLVPRDVLEETQRLSLEVLGNHLDTDQLQQCLSAIAAEREELLQMPLTTIRQKPWSSDTFIDARIGGAALYSALSQVVGADSALKMILEIAEVTAPRFTPYWWPASEDFLSFDDPFATFKDWFLSLWEADREIGAHQYVLTENSDDTVQVDVTYCAWYDTYRQLGMGDACRGECYAANVVFPKLCTPVGIRFIKKGTLSEGAAVCDYRIERVKD